jgi:uncharacterized protein (TIRG00374 family)
MKFGWRGILGLAISVALLVWTLHDIPFGEVWEVLRTSNLPLLVLSAVVATLVFPIRAVRWRYILEPLAPELPLGMLWRAIAIGMMINNTVPARAGEVARAYALARETERVPFTGAFASLVIDRVFDAIIIIVLLGVALLAPDFPGVTTIAGQPISRLAIGVAGVAVAALVGLAALAFFPGTVLAIFDAVIGRVAPRFGERGRALVVSFANGLGALRSLRLFILIFVWTLLHWLVAAFSFWIAFRAVGIHVPFNAALFVQGLTAISVALPSSPGYFGVFETVGRAGLAVYGVPAGLAVSWAIGYHVLSFIPITVIGAWYFVQLGLHFRELGQAAPAES